MILKAKHHKFIYPFFRIYTLHLLKRHFNKIHITGDYVSEKLPVLLLANHFSWWDGFFALYLNIKMFKKKFYFMMLEEQLRKYWYFNFSGGFSVKRKSRSVIESLNYTAELLTACGNLVLIFPQGEIQSIHRQTFIFERGIERILQNRPDKIQVVFLVSLIDYFSNKKPDIYFYLSVYTGHSFDLKTIQEHYNRFYMKSVTQQNQIKG